MSQIATRVLRNPRRTAIISGACVLGAIGFLLANKAPKVLLWNVTPSVPQGLYWIRSDRTPVAGEIAVAWLPNGAARLANERHYLPFGVPLVKPVAAGPGHIVCRHNDGIFIDGALRGYALDHDQAGRDLPRWGGCSRLSADKVFLMNTAVATSFDSRYFGPVNARAISGEAIPILIKHNGGPSGWRLFP
jgi:conjugative transfer signal peptidase TraF